MVEFMKLLLQRKLLQYQVSLPHKRKQLLVCQLLPARKKQIEN